MKDLNIEDLENLPGKLLKKGETFSFRCHSGLACFNRCCRNLNLMLYPYDVLRLKQNLGISSDGFLDEHVDIVLRPGTHFPEVLLRMADNEEKTCPFLTEKGCSVYPDRPDTCRRFPVEQGAVIDENLRVKEVFHLYRPPEFCLGKNEAQPWTSESWSRNQEGEKHEKMTLRWAQIRHRFQADPWNGQGPGCPNGKMAFMATYNVDAFRDFVFNSSFLKRFKIKTETVRRIKTDDVELLKLGFEWVMLFIWGIPSKMIRPR
ncbi:MAG: YkgJ family cysteine cluster protein [Proteobacteria bacterium]|nr:YkgJ family cysteine cluster protein [Pseudomonadota bacterium]